MRKSLKHLSLAFIDFAAAALLYASRRARSAGALLRKQITSDGLDKKNWSQLAQSEKKMPVIHQPEK